MNSILIVCLAFGIAAVTCANVKDSGILVQESNIEKDGKFHYHVETGEGTKITQDGQLKNIASDKDGEAVTGEFSFQGDDGKNYGITYTADENGYVPHGESIPTSPPIPPAIQRSLDYIAQHPYVEPSKLNSVKG